MSEWPSGSTPIASRIRSFDWSATPLGHIDGWPQSLRTVVDLMLASPSMMSLVWGAEATHLYNDSFTELLREHTVASLGRSAFDTFARSRDAFEADLAAGMAGQSSRLLTQRYPVLRKGRLEDAWFDVDYTPVRDEAGAVAGVLWYLREVTAQVLAERALHESEARHRLLIGSWAQATWETDATGIVVSDSPSWRAYTGQTLDEWLGYGWLDAIHPDDRAYAERQWRDAVAARWLVDAEFRLRAPDGRWRWTNVRAAPVLDAEGKVVKWAGMNIDIDVRRRAEAAVRESDARLAQLADAAPVLIWETDANGATFVNSHYLTYFGVKFADLAGFGWARFVHPDDRDGYVAAYSHAFAERRSYDYECRLLRADGQYRWHRTSAGPAGDGRFIGSCTDIHDLVMAEQALREREERLSGVLDGMAEGFGIIGADFTILEHNREALRMDGRSREEIVGRSHWEAFPGTEHSDVGRLLKTAMADRQPATLVHRYAWVNGGAAWLELRVYPTPDGGLAVFWRDVTAWKEADDAHRESEQRYRRLFTSMDEAYAVVDVLKDEAGRWADFRFVEVNPAFIEHTSMPWPVGKTATELLGTPNPRWTQLYGEALDTDRSIRVEEAEPTLDRIFDLNIFALDHEHNRVAVLFTNVTERKKAEAALRASEELRRIALESGGMGAWTWDTRDRTVRADEAFQDLWGVSFGGQPHPVSTYTDRMDGRGAASLEAVMAMHIVPGQSFQDQVQVSDGPKAGRWVQWRGRAEEDRPWIINGVSFDITDQRELAERQQVLVAELQHRTRNILAVVRSMADKTARASADLPDFRERFRDRLEALSRVQRLLSRLNEHDRVTFDELIETELAAMSNEADRVHLDGPRGVRLRSSMVQTLAMALHELATNAVKYGALGQANGHLDVTWRLSRAKGNHDPRLHIDWRERGVEMPLPGSRPSGTGQGRELIERALPYQLKAETTYTLGPDGVHCTISVPVSVSNAEAPADA